MAPAHPLRYELKPGTSSSRAVQNRGALYYRVQILVISLTQVGSRGALTKSHCNIEKLVFEAYNTIFGSLRATFDFSSCYRTREPKLIGAALCPVGVFVAPLHNSHRPHTTSVPPARNRTEPSCPAYMVRRERCSLPHFGRFRPFAQATTLL